jgi:hypothetical protein
VEPACGTPFDSADEISSGKNTHHEHRLPTGFDVANLQQDHPGHLPDDKFPNLLGPTLPYDDHKRLEKVILKRHAGQLRPFQEFLCNLHSTLTSYCVPLAGI